MASPASRSAMAILSESVSMPETTSHPPISFPVRRGGSAGADTAAATQSRLHRNAGGRCVPGSLASKKTLNRSTWAPSPAVWAAQSLQVSGRVEAGSRPPHGAPPPVRRTRRSRAWDLDAQVLSPRPFEQVLPTRTVDPARERTRPHSSSSKRGIARSALRYRFAPDDATDASGALARATFPIPETTSQVVR